MSGQIILLGAGGFAREAFIWCAHAGHHVGAFFDNTQTARNTIDRVPVQKVLTPEWRYLIAVGDPSIKIKLNYIAQDAGLEIVSAIAHPSVIFGSNVAVADGSIICPRAVLTTDIRIGKHVLVNLGATIGHDVDIDDFTTISPGANISGRCRIGRAVYIGTNAAIREGVRIGDNATIGMGAVVLQDVPANETWVGVPARKAL